MDECIEVEVSTTTCAPVRRQLLHWPLIALQSEARRQRVGVGVARMHKHDLAELLAEKILSTGRVTVGGRDVSS